MYYGTALNSDKNTLSGTRKDCTKVRGNLNTSLWKTLKSSRVIKKYVCRLTCKYLHFKQKHELAIQLPNTNDSRAFQKVWCVHTFVATPECIECRKNYVSSVCHLSYLLNKIVYILKAVQPKKANIFIISHKIYFKYYWFHSFVRQPVLKSHRLHRHHNSLAEDRGQVQSWPAAVLR